MKKLLIFTLSTLLFTACQSRKDGNGGEEQTASDATASATQPNELSEAESADGWQLLFNGRDMDGWKTYKDRENDSWEVVDGTLHCKADSAAEKRADIRTVEEYGDFDLVFEWKIAPTDNSGVIYRATEEFDQAYLSGPEYQVIDDKGYPDPLSPTQTSASNYDMHAAPDDKPVNPPGQWNTGRIVAKGNHVEHWLNGTKVLEYEINSPDWKERKENSKWKDASGYGAAARGYIDLQDHGVEVWYRNIKIKTL